MGKNCLLNISEVKGLKYTPNNLFFTNVPDKKKYQDISQLYDSRRKFQCCVF